MGTGGDIGSGDSLSSCFLSWCQCLGLICNFLKSDCVNSSSGDMDAASVSRNVPHRNFSSMTGRRVATNSTMKSKPADVLSSAFPWLYDCRCRRCGDGSSCFLNLAEPLNCRLEDSRRVLGVVMTPERLAQCCCRTTNRPYVQMQLWRSLYFPDTGDVTTCFCLAIPRDSSPIYYAILCNCLSVCSCQTPSRSRSPHDLPQSIYTVREL